MPNPNTPNTKLIAQAIATFLAGITYPGTTSKVYAATSMGEIKDVIDVLPCGEVYGNRDNSKRYSGSKMHDHQSFFVVSIVDLTSSATAEAQVFDIRDAIMPWFAQHVQLGGLSNVLKAEYLQDSGRFTRIVRNEEWFRAHVMELAVTQTWTVAGGYTA